MIDLLTTLGSMLPFNIGLTLRLPSPSIQKSPNLSGTWLTHYLYILDGEVVEASEYVRVKKGFSRTTAETQMIKPEKRQWKLVGRVSERYWSGQVMADDRKTLSGSGVYL